MVVEEVSFFKSGRVIGTAANESAFGGTGCFAVVCMMGIETPAKEMEFLAFFGDDDSPCVSVLNPNAFRILLPLEGAVGVPAAAAATDAAAEEAATEAAGDTGGAGVVESLLAGVFHPRSTGVGKLCLCFLDRGLRFISGKRND